MLSQTTKYVGRINTFLGLTFFSSQIPFLKWLLKIDGTKIGEEKEEDNPGSRKSNTGERCEEKSQDNG